MLRVTAPAKVNLFLGVGEPRPDGYHDVTTVLHALELHDIVEIEPAPALTVSCDVDLGVRATQNLAHRAARALGEELQRDPAVHISVRKRIPHGAGLGGGSSDAAAVIAGLAHLWDVDAGDERCVRAAQSLGADVPFFLSRTGAALMTGRGDTFAREVPGLRGAFVALVKPAEPVPTADAYRLFDEDPGEPGDPRPLLQALDAGDVTGVARRLSNNLSHVAQVIVPAIGAVLSSVRAHAGVLGAQVAGSGSAVFAVCEDAAAAERVASLGADMGHWSAVTALRARGVEVEGA